MAEQASTTYPFVLRQENGRPTAIALLKLPDGLTAEEAERLCAYIKTLVLPEERRNA